MDYYGQRLATASSDRSIRIFETVPGQPEKFLAELKGHEGPVWQVSWAPPKFGSLLASCSYDGSVIVWKEQDGKWIKAKLYKGHEGSVNAVSWAPVEFGLQLACAGSDGKISVLSYNEADASWNEASWTAHQIGCNSVNWCPSFSASILSEQQPPQEEVLRLASGGCDNLVKIWKQSADGWTVEETLAGHSDWVRDVSWAPSLGLPMSILVSCSQDRQVLIWRNASINKNGSWSKSLLTPEPFADTLWRVQFSPNGSLLAVAGGDNKVSMWRETPQGDWQCLNSLDQSQL